jgi:ABC-type multidrug transport system fused ATPase/permease subunit
VYGLVRLVRYADQIFVIDKGEVIESETHSKLLEVGGKYCELWTKQTAGTLDKDESK